MKRARPGVTSISAARPISGVDELDHRGLLICKHLILNSQGTLPVVTRFFWPPDMPLSILFPTIVSAQISSPKTYKLLKYTIIIGHVILFNLLKYLRTWEVNLLAL